MTSTSTNLAHNQQTPCGKMDLTPFKPFISMVMVVFISAATVLSPIISQQAHAQGLLRDAEIEQWVHDYSFPILEAAEIDPETITFLIVGDPSPNAFAGGRTMGIFTGLITTADYPNEVEGVIAHEVGHLKGEHSTRRADAFAAASRPILLSLLLAGAAVAAGAPEAAFGIFGLGQHIGTVNALAYSQSNESSADASAIRYLETIGHSGQGLVDFFDKLRNPQVLRSRKLNPYLSTHPLAIDRVTALTENVNNSQYADVKDSPEDIARFRLIQAKIRGFLDAPKFTLRRYPLSDKSDPARYARAVAFYRSADIEGSLSEINFLLEKNPDNPYFQELKGQMLFETGRTYESIEPHRRSVELAPDKALLRVNLGRALLSTEDTKNVVESIDVLKSALRIESGNSFGWYELARAHGHMGDEGLALLCTAESKYYGGAKGEANQFARRSLKYFNRGSREWLQAQDILVAVNGSGNRRGATNRKRGGKGGKGRRGGNGGKRPGDNNKTKKEQENTPESEKGPKEEIEEITLPEDGRIPEPDLLPEAPRE